VQYGASASSAASATSLSAAHSRPTIDRLTFATNFKINNGRRRGTTTAASDLERLSPYHLQRHMAPPACCKSNGFFHRLRDENPSLRRNTTPYSCGKPRCRRHRCMLTKPSVASGLSRSRTGWFQVADTILTPYAPRSATISQSTYAGRHRIGDVKRYSLNHCGEHHRRPMAGGLNRWTLVFAAAS